MIMGLKSGHVHKYEVVLWTSEKLRKITEIHVYTKSYTERLVLAKVEKVLSLYRNNKKVTLLLFDFKQSILKNCHINRQLHLIAYWKSLQNIQEQS